MKLRTLLALTLLALLLPSAATGQEGSRTIAVQAQLHDTALGPHMVPERIDARVGDTLVVEVVNQGTTKHNVVFCAEPKESATCAERLAFTPLMDPGAVRNLTFTVTEPGTFEYYCDVPGHRQGGMRGELLVQGEAKKETPLPGLALALLALAGLALATRRR